MKTAIVFVVVILVAGQFFDALASFGRFYDRTIVPGFVDIVESLTPYNWEKTKPSPENDAKELVLKVAPKAIYAWGSKSIDGIPLSFKSTPEKRVVQDKDVKRIKKINVLEEINKERNPIIFIEFKSISSSPLDSSHKILVMNAYVEKPNDYEMPLAGYSKLMKVIILGELDTDTGSAWKLIQIQVENYGGVITRPDRLLSQYPTPEEVNNIYMSREAISKNILTRWFEYDKPSDRLDHVMYNARYFY